VTWGWHGLYNGDIMMVKWWYHRGRNGDIRGRSWGYNGDIGVKIGLS